MKKFGKILMMKSEEYKKYLKILITKKIPGI